MNNQPQIGPNSSVAPQVSGDPMVTRDERTLAMLAHVLQIFSWLIAPIIIYFVRRDSAFVRYHALQAIFWQLFVIVAGILAGVAILAMLMGTAMRDLAPGGPPPPVFFAVVFSFWGFAALAWVLNVVLGIVYGIKSNNGEWAGYPGLKHLAARAAGIQL